MKITKEQIEQGTDKELSTWVAEYVMEIGAPARLPSPYSTSLWAAWKILEKADEWTMTKDFDNVSCWIEIFGNDCSGRGETAPIAICRAALLAVRKNH